jgi:hypothetical protein
MRSAAGLVAAGVLLAACSFIRRTSDLGPPGAPDLSSSGGGGGGGCPACTVVDEGIYQARAIAVSDDAVFYAESPAQATSGVIYRQNKSGGDSSAFIKTSSLAPRSIAIDADGRIVWLGEGDGYGLAARCPSQGCVVTETAAAFETSPPEALLEEGELNVDSIVTDALGVYWTATPDNETGPNGTVRSCAAAGCTNKTAKILADEEDTPRGIAVDATHVYWVNEGDGRVRRVAKDGVATPENVMTGLTKPQAIVLQGNTIYVSTAQDGGSILTMPKAAPAPAFAVMVSKQTGIAALAADASGIYWTTFLPSGTVATCPLEGACTANVIARVPNPFALALDTSDVWFTTRSDQGTVYHVKKTVRAP